MLFWLSLLMTSCSWFFILDFYVVKSVNIGIIFLVTGVLLYIYSTHNRYGVLNIPNTLVNFGIVSFIVSFFIFQFPYNLGFIPLVISFLLLKIKTEYNVNKFGYAFFIVGLILLSQSLVVILSSSILSRVHDFPYLKYIIINIFKMLQFDVTEIGSNIYFNTAQNYYNFLITYEKMGVLFILLFLVSYFIVNLFIIKNELIEKSINVVLICVLYMMFRIILLMILYSEFGLFSTFTKPLYIFITFIPMLVILKIYYPYDYDFNEFKIKYADISINNVKLILLILLMTFSFVSIRGYQDLGLKKNGRILIDEYHSDWEWTTEEFNKTTFGHRSVYNYYSMVDYLSKYYSISINTDGPLIESLLNNYDILILKCPTSAYSTEEIKAVINFVERGGGLFLIGDHTNLFGMNFYLNKIANHFGIRFNYDDTFNMTSGYLSIYRPNDLLKHVSLNYVDAFKFATSCSINAPLSAWEVMMGYGLGQEDVHFSHKYFFGDIQVDPEDRFGSFLQAVALNYKKGRIMAFSDSTVFSNFSIFFKGCPEYLLGCIEYLNRTNILQNSGLLFSILFVLLSVSFIYFMNKTMYKKKILIYLVIMAPLTASVTLYSYNLLNKRNYNSPEPLINYTQICFVHEYSNYQLKSLIGATEVITNYETFFVWIQRLGYIPVEVNYLDESLEIGDAIVLINPTQKFNREDIAKIDGYLRKGGRILLLDSIQNELSTSNMLLENYGIEIQRYLKEENSSYIGTNLMSEYLIPSISIIGGSPILKNHNSDAIISSVKVGNGKLVIALDSSMFSTVGMKVPNYAPDNTTLGVFSSVFYLFEDVLMK